MQDMTLQSAATSKFDAEWYATTYRDVPLTGLDPLEHYTRYGRFLGRKPYADFLDGQKPKPTAHATQIQGAINIPYLACNQVAIDAQVRNGWVSEGEDPFFILDLSHLAISAKRWYRVTVNIRTETKRGCAKFYLDIGSGFNEADTLTLPYTANEPVGRLVYLKRDLLNLRFDPKEHAGAFAINAMDFSPVSEADAEREILERLTDEHQAYQGKCSGEILAELGKQGRDDLHRNLLARYGETFSSSEPPVEYREWIDTVETPGMPNADQAAAAIRALANQPLISIVMPVYNTPEVYLRACIDSVVRQSYPRWELCIADDKSPAGHIQQVLGFYEAQDSRIRVVYRKENGHISAASNSALAIAHGDFVALIDHDDVLPEHALLYMAQAINENTGVQILYSDEDKLNAKGERIDPHFKSDWNPDLFFSQNYVSHLGVYHRNLLEKINGFRIGVEGSQDQDLLLRCLPHVKPEQIVHIPRVLYHWRTVEGSTALASGEKSYTTEAGIRSLRDHFAGQQNDILVEAGLLPNTYRVRYPIPTPAPLVSLLIPTRDRRALTETCIRSILEKSSYKHYEILILDNDSIETDTLEFFRTIQQEDKRVRVLRYDHPFNYSAINNFGVQHAKGSIIGLVNNDIEVINNDWLGEMVSHANRPEIGCVGAKLYYSNDTIQHAGVIIGIGGVGGHSHKNFPRHKPGYFSRLMLPQNLSAVTAACLLVRREIYEEVDGLDEIELKVAFNDVDFCLKVREAGYRNLWTPYAELYHHESVSRGHEDSPEKVARFQKEVGHMKSKWGDILKFDPYYSPNLTKEREDFSVGLSEGGFK